MQLFRSRLIQCAAVSLLAVLGVSAASGQSCLNIVPASLSSDFGKQAVGTVTLLPHDVVLTNKCTTSVTLSSFSVTPPFELAMGYAPWTIPAGVQLSLGARFAPNAAQAFTGNFTLNIANNPSIVISLTGTGFVTGAVASLSAPSLTFGNTQIGKTSNVQTVTLTNTGTTSMTVLTVYTEPPFSVSGYTGGTQGTVIAPDGQLPLKVAFGPSLTGNYIGNLVITSDVLNPVGVTLSGTAVPSTSFAITNFVNLPQATQGAAYSATLTSVGGVGAVTWTGLNLPKGLTVSSSGIISGTLPSTITLGTYRFQVTATDSLSHSVTDHVSMVVSAPTGAHCNNISWNVGGTTNPIIPMNDLGTGTYLGVEGGLYLNGSNVMPGSHDSDGVALAKAIQPLDANGNPDPNGKYALLSIGLSITFENFNQLKQGVASDTSLNPHLVFANGANPNLTAGRFANTTDPIWTTETDYFLPNADITANQVVAVWIMVIDGFPSGTFPTDLANLESQYISILQNLHNFFPNLKLAFFSTREYGAYSNGNTQLVDPEPYAYETGFAVRQVIQDQLNGEADLNYNSSNGPVVAPWIAWATYDWANGMTPRSDGLYWTCQDFLPDGEHNSYPAGRQKASAMLLNFLKTNDATAPWVLAP